MLVSVSLFNIVRYLLIMIQIPGLINRFCSRFNNDPCVGGSNKNGTCYLADECSSKGGTNSGSCAAGYGVCCTCKLQVHHVFIEYTIHWFICRSSHLKMWFLVQRKLHLLWIFWIGNWRLQRQDLPVWFQCLPGDGTEWIQKIQQNLTIVPFAATAGLFYILHHWTLDINSFSCENNRWSGMDNICLFMFEIEPNSR